MKAPQVDAWDGVGALGAVLLAGGVVALWGSVGAIACGLVLLTAYVLRELRLAGRI